MCIHTIKQKIQCIESVVGVEAHINQLIINNLTNKSKVYKPTKVSLPTFKSGQHIVVKLERTDQHGDDTWHHGILIGNKTKTLALMHEVEFSFAKGGLLSYLRLTIQLTKGVVNSVDDDFVIDIHDGKPSLRSWQEFLKNANIRGGVVQIDYLGQDAVAQKDAVRMALLFCLNPSIWRSYDLGAHACLDFCRHVRCKTSSDLHAGHVGNF